MIINTGITKYAYKLLVVMFAIILPEKTMAKASKFLRESEPNKKTKTIKKSNLISKKDTS